jgi:hypothetical protein
LYRHNKRKFCKKLEKKTVHRNNLITAMHC